MTDLIKIRGIGSSVVEKLKEAGITNIKQLSQTNPESISKIKGIGLTSAKRWIENAKKIMSGEDTIKTRTPPKSIKTQPKTTSQKAKSRSSTSRPTTQKKTPPQKKKVVLKEMDKSSTSRTITPQRKKESEPLFEDTAEPIPRFLLDRFSKNALKVLYLSFKSLNQENVKNLEKYQQILAPERIKFNPYYEDEKNALKAIDEKLKFLENLILRSKEGAMKGYLNDFIVKALERGVFNAIIKKLGKKIGPEQAAIKIFDGINKKVKKDLLTRATEITNIRDIQKIIEELYPEKVELFYKRKK